MIITGPTSPPPSLPRSPRPFITSARVDARITPVCPCGTYDRPIPGGDWDGDRFGATGTVGVDPGRRRAGQVRPHRGQGLFGAAPRPVRPAPGTGALRGGSATGQARTRDRSSSGRLRDRSGPHQGQELFGAAPRPVRPAPGTGAAPRPVRPAPGGLLGVAPRRGQVRTGAAAG